LLASLLMHLEVGMVRKIPLAVWRDADVVCVRAPASSAVPLSIEIPDLEWRLEEARVMHAQGRVTEAVRLARRVAEVAPSIRDSEKWPITYRALRYAGQWLAQARAVSSSEITSLLESAHESAKVDDLKALGKCSFVWGSYLGEDMREKKERNRETQYRFNPSFCVLLCCVPDSLYKEAIRLQEAEADEWRVRGVCGKGREVMYT
jgi:hypothetical protein